ncbi:MAG: MerR family transcriptional regulator [Pseudomonadota bacterium]
MNKPSKTTSAAPPDRPGDDAGAYRSGVAARLAGLPVETLRVWERRYGISSTERSAHGQRLYSAQQVHRLGLLKRVVDQGHPIGTVATLPAERLMELAGAAARPAAAGVPAQAIRVALVGSGMGRRLAGSAASQALDIVRTCATLADAPRAFDGVQAEVVLIEAPELSAEAAPLIAAARQAAGAQAVVVMYRFCDSATIRLLRAQACLVARVPTDAAEVASLCSAALAGHLPALIPPAPAAIARRLDDDALAVLSAAPNNINCECPRHLAEILMMLGSFERYSVQCAARNDDDAALHQELGHAAAQARVLLESAMERLARAEGLPLPAALR